MTHAPRSLGVRLITVYKMTKGTLVFSLALWLSIAPESAVDLAERLVREMSEGGATLARLARFLSVHLSTKIAVRAAVLAWVDGISTIVEGLLLLQGSALAQWIVVASLGALVPFEAASLEHHPTATRLTVLILNAGIVAYLVYDRLKERRASSEARSSIGGR